MRRIVLLTPRIAIRFSMMRIHPHRVTRRARWNVLCLSLLFLLALHSPPASAQTAIVREEENIRVRPNGDILGKVRPGTVLAVNRAEGKWLHVTLRGWVWTASLGTVDHESFDLRVSARGGENLRRQPRGAILARLVRGTFLEEIERGRGWIRVQRKVWIWSASVDLESDAAAEEDQTEAKDKNGGKDKKEAKDDPRDLLKRWRASGKGGSVILAGPDGDTIAKSRPGTPLQILAREGNWARIRIEGWTWLPHGSDSTLASDTTVLAEATPDEVRKNADRFKGRVVAWELQLISMEKAERVRTDFYAGEPYLLTRSDARGGGFVYVALPPDLVEELKGLVPMGRVFVVGRIRTGATALTGNPLLDLMELRVR